MQDDRDLLDESELEVWEAQQPPAEPRAGLALPILIVLSGVVLLFVLGVLDAWAMEKQPWSSALLYAEPLPVPEDEDLLPVMLRRLPEARSPLIEMLEQMPRGAEIIAGLQLDKGEWVVLLPVSDEALAGFLASGRIPSRGRFEAVAGDLARDVPFVLDGHEFEIVGRLERGVGGMAFAFVVPDDEVYRPLFAPETGATRGWLDLAGRERLSGLTEEEGEQWPEPVVVVMRAGRGVAIGVILGLVLVAIGGSVTYYRVFLQLVRRGVRGAQFLLEEVANRPRLFAGLHVLMYGSFFAMMVVATVYPLAALRLGQYVRQEFAEGSLRHVGAAYESGDILLAAAATFAHNYIFATILATFAVSLIIPFGGVLSNLRTFMVTGFAMAPLWAGAAWGMSFHSITMAIELGAYIVASFAVAVLWLRIGRGISGGGFRRELGRGLRAFGGGIVVSGVMLAIAAVYEAASLILLA